MKAFCMLQKSASFGKLYVLPKIHKMLFDVPDGQEYQTVLNQPEKYQNF